MAPQESYPGGHNRPSSHFDCPLHCTTGERLPLETSRQLSRQRLLISLRTLSTATRHL